VLNIRIYGVYTFIKKTNINAQWICIVA